MVVFVFVQASGKQGPHPYIDFTFLPSIARNTNKQAYFILEEECRNSVVFRHICHQQTAYFRNGFFL